MNLSWEFSDEVIVARVNQVVKYLLLGSESSTVTDFKKKLLCINGSYDKALIPYEDDYGTGNQPVTDREKLAKMIATLADASTPPDLVVLDLFLDGPSPEDSLLRYHLSRIPAVVISASEDDEGKPVYRWPEFAYGLPYYETTTGSFLKYQLTSPEAVYLATAMYQSQHKTSFHWRIGLARTEDNWWHNSFLLDLPIRRNLFETNEVILWNLGEALNLFASNEIQQIASNRIVLIGDFFQYDEHETLLGEQPGPLIVANAYLALLEETPLIRFVDGLLIFFLYFFSGYYVITFRQKGRHLFGRGTDRSRFTKFITTYFSYLLIFSIYSIGLYLLTGRHFQLLLFALYFQLIDWLSSKYHVTAIQR